jgi:ATP-dependent helicase/nuclease subunit A
VNQPNPRFEEAKLAQRDAADPAGSVWVAANAGSGKTYVLTSRIVRLLLAGARPSAILCLTFTKAAAAEMATRLARELGRWAVEPEAALAARLAGLLGRAPAREDLDAARGLFARVLELPGGMRISTIHAFCQSLLRAFPLEAGLAPQFGVVEDADAASLLAEAREAVLAGPATPAAALEALASLVPPDAFAKLVRALDGDRERLAAALRGTGSLDGLCAAIAAHLDLPAGAHEGALVAEAAASVEAQALIAARLLEASRNENDRARGARIVAWLEMDTAARAARWGEWCEIFLT